MATITLSDIKEHLSVTTDDDNLSIAEKLESALAIIEQLLGIEVDREIGESIQVQAP